MAADEATTQDWLWESDTQMRLTYSNAGSFELLGYAPEEVVGVSLVDLMAAEDRCIYLELQSTATRAGATSWTKREARWLHRSGHTVVLEGSALPIRDLRGNVVGFRGTRSRVTESVLSGRLASAARTRVADVIEHASLDVAFQPIVNVATGRLAGVEALARFRDGRGPEEWFRDAHAAALALELDGFAFAAALDAARRLHPTCYVSINASPALVLAMPLAHLVATSGLPASRVVIEITEQARVDDYAALNAALAPLRAAGTRIAVDDTGAGYASLSHVLQLRPDIIKIDRSLITRVETDAARRSLMTSLVLLALDLGAEVTGEGVETSLELHTLATLGVDYGQGYLLGKPTLDHEEWSRWPHRRWEMSTPIHDARVR
jgi:PAS domain S-box-containing protein